MVSEKRKKEEMSNFEEKRDDNRSLIKYDKPVIVTGSSKNITNRIDKFDLRQ